MPETLRSEQRTARKNYRCGMCDGPIDSGDRYHASANLYDGRVYDFRTCSGAERWLSRCGCTCERCESTTPPDRAEVAALPKETSNG